MTTTDWYGVTFLALILGVALNAAYTALIASRTTRIVGQLHHRISEMESASQRTSKPNTVAPRSPGRTRYRALDDWREADR